MAERVTFRDRLSHGWSAFSNKDPTLTKAPDGVGPASYDRPDRRRMFIATERSMLAAIITRLAIDVSNIDIRHVKVDGNGRFVGWVNSPLNNCLTVEANIDQTGRAFRQDAAQSMFDEGVVALVPVDTTFDPRVTGSYSVDTMRTGQVTAWYPRHVKVRIYNDRTGLREEVLLPKATVAIVENPLYAVMNEPNSTLKRLTHKLALLDSIDEQSSSGKLDLIIQLPYVIKTEARRQQAEIRRKDIEMQLKGSQYGIAYTDGSERVTQLNRPAENNLMTQITYLTSMLYGQLGLTEGIINGTAGEKELLNYYNRTVEPCVAAIADGMKRSFLTKTARTQGHSVMYFRDPFKLVSVAELSTLGDSFVRNEILSSNEIRGIIGYLPSENPKADDLRNPNMPQEEPQQPVDPFGVPSNSGDQTQEPAEPEEYDLYSELVEASRKSGGLLNA